MGDLPDAKPCLHACQAECGRTYDVIVVQPVDGSTLFYCIPCMLNFTAQLMQSMVEPDNADVLAVVESNPLTDVAYVTADPQEYRVRDTSDAVEDSFFDSEPAD